MLSPRLAFILPVLLLAGCASSTEEKRPVPIAGGHVVGISFGPQGPLPGRADGYEVVYAAAIPDAKEKQIVYHFMFKAPPGVSLQRVQVDDISEEQPSSMIDDQQPWLAENRWEMKTPPINAGDSRLKWIYTVTPTMRVYLFTITDKNGRQSTMYQLVGYPDFLKSAIRQRWGEKY